MAVNLCSDNSGGSLVMSPRISFSHNLCQADISSHHHHQQQQQQQEFHRSDSTLLESSCDFDFCISSESFKDEESSTTAADELFSNGKLLPLQIREKLFTPRQQLQFHDQQQQPLPPLPPLPSTAKTTTTTTVDVDVDDDSKKESLKEIMGMSSSESTTEKSQSKSFWRFKRSASVGNGGYKRSLICSLPLLSRSNSTGSTVPNSKRTSSSSSSSSSSLSKENSKNLQKPPSTKSSSPYYLSSSSSSSSQKPPLKKNYGSYNNGVRISPVLNVPPPYISKGTANLFGLGSFFCNGKDKNKKK